jgi:hypothetical protein
MRGDVKKRNEREREWEREWEREREREKEKEIKSYEVLSSSKQHICGSDGHVSNQWPIHHVSKIDDSSDDVILLMPNDHIIRIEVIEDRLVT